MSRSDGGRGASGPTAAERLSAGGGGGAGASDARAAPSGEGPAPDTIAAVATAPGPGGVAIVRVSGPGARAVLARVAPETGEPPARTPVLARVCGADGRPVDRALVTLFPRPGSYTGEDVVEISGHGGWLAPRQVLEACLAAGARAAEPGEFTRRAYLHGKLDLLQAEAVLDLVEGRAPAQGRAALHQLERGLSARIGALRERVVDLEAVLVHQIDFPEEDDSPVTTEEVVRRAVALAEDLDRLRRTAPEGELLREGALTVLAGPPNAGKSSLFNALIGTERALVTSVPGTTRDALEAVVSLRGFPFRLVDTAGLRAGAEGVEALGIEVARRYLAHADLVLLCLPAGDADGEGVERSAAALRGLGLPSGVPVVLVRTRSDEAETGADDAMAGGDEPGPALRSEDVVGRVRTSVVDGRGLDALRDTLVEAVFSGLTATGGDQPVLTRARQARGVDEAAGAMRSFAGALAAGVPAEVAAAHLRQAEGALEAVVGTIGREEVLDRLFRAFCIGK